MDGKEQTQFVHVSLVHQPPRWQPHPPETQPTQNRQKVRTWRHAHYCRVSRTAIESLPLPFLEHLSGGPCSWFHHPLAYMFRGASQCAPMCSSKVGILREEGRKSMIHCEVRLWVLFTQRVAGILNWQVPLNYFMHFPAKLGHDLARAWSTMFTSRLVHCNSRFEQKAKHHSY